MHIRDLFNSGRWLTLLLATHAAACFTADPLQDQPCNTDEDCNPNIDALGKRLTCTYNICGYASRCGDGIVDATETCDNGEANVDDDYGGGAGECSSVSCTLLPYCGDGSVDPAYEGCDDGNADDRDLCPSTCEPATCGDGFVGPGEACDPKVNEACTVDCRLPTCGDGKPDPGEECDDGNRDDGDACPSTCMIASCGDGFVGPDEECDDGNDDNQDSCVASCEDAYCGDGFVGPGEACDDGDDDEETCTNLCAGPLCGDGVVQASQEEECDDGNDVDTDACLSTCLKAKCGDAVVQASSKEECDDGNSSYADECLPTCKLNTCGDGYLGPNEICDDNNANPFDECVSCMLAECGDGVQYKGVEECDDKNTEDGDGCSSECKHEECGDGIKLETEECDDGNKIDGDGCTKDCAFEYCGDGALQGQEECDDGNQVITDGCLGCAFAKCGDGVTWLGKEECDDNNEVDTDACISCEFATCGDGYVWMGEEECDDANQSNLDPCLNTCLLSTCGDGFLGPGEACDDGNQSNLDPCLNTCLLNTCGDGYVDATTEGCDDQDNDDDDGCSNSCEMGAVALGGGPEAGHFCAIRQGQVRCWGLNDYGQLGIGSSANLGDDPGDLPAGAVEVPVNSPATNVAMVTSGRRHTCVLLDPYDQDQENTIRCWGNAHYGKLGWGLEGGSYGDQPGEVELTEVIPLNAVDIAAGDLHTCAVLAEGGVRCWGYASYGQLGQASKQNGTPPDKMPDIDLGVGKATQVVAGENHSCALLDDGTVRCWGDNADGVLGLAKSWGQLPQLGDDEKPSTEAPVKVGKPVLQLAAGGDHTCAVVEGGRVRCWGYGLWGVLGYGNSDSIGDDEHPADAGDVTMLAQDDVAIKVVVDRSHTCVLLEGGGVRCWGYGGILGYGDTKSYGTGQDKPPLVNLGYPALDIVAGWASTCALLQGGRIRCWGNNNFGQLGVGHTEPIGDEPGEMPPSSVKIYPNP